MAKEKDDGLSERAEEKLDAPEAKESAALRDKEVCELTNDIKRLQAEFENYKKRVERDGAERAQLANQRLIADLLPVLDSFDKALEDRNDQGDDGHLRTGLIGLQKQLLQTLRKEGLKEIPTSGKFDPFLHEAILREERDDVEDGKILEVYQKGYMLQQRTLRPARVKVARPKAVEKAGIHDTQDDETITDENQGKR